MSRLSQSVPAPSG